MCSFQKESKHFGLEISVVYGVLAHFELNYFLYNCAKLS